MKLNIPPLSQKDARWSRKKLGTSSVTIGNYGCLLTCHSMMLCYYGHDDLLPDTLNELYKNKKVFDPKGQINFWAAANCFDDISGDEHYQCYDVPCDLKKIDKYLNEKKPVIALVDFSPKAGVQTHFVIIIGKDEAGSYIVNDPWFGDEQYFQNRYGDDPAKFIYGLRLYSGEVKYEIPLEDQVKDLEDKIKVQDELLLERAATIGMLEGELEATEKREAAVKAELNQARSERDKAMGEKKALENQVASLKGKVDMLKTENTTLRERLKGSANVKIRALPLWEILKIKYLRGGEKGGS